LNKNCVCRSNDNWHDLAWSRQCRYCNSVVANVISFVRRIFARENISSFESAGNMVEGIANSTVSESRAKGDMDPLGRNLGQVTRQDKKDKQSKNGTQFSLVQNLFSNSCQECNRSLNILHMIFF
jgi:hypothetical protein